MNISINKNNVLNYGKQLIDCSIEFENEIKKFNSIIESINTVWEGADALKYINTMHDKYNVGLDELKDTMEKYGLYLKIIPNAYSSLDEAFSSKNINV